MGKRIIFVIFVLGIALVACNSGLSEPRISVEEAWARPPATEGGNGAIYFRVVNEGGEPDTLFGVSSSLVTAELHETVEKENGVMGMEPVESVEIPARGELVLEPGGMHVMLIGLEQSLAAGDSVPLTLQFEHAGALRLEVVVRTP